MVRKLLKHDLKSVLRIILPMQAILLVIGIFSKIIKLIPIENDFLTAIEFAIVGSFYITAVVSAILTVIVIVVRFYKNLFSKEGYLTFTLPATPMQHLFSKIFMSAIASIISAVCIFISVIVLYYEKNFITDSIEILLIVFNRLGEKMLVLEVLILMIVAMISTYLMVYTCICLGQRANKHRIICAVAIYYGYQFVLQTLGIAVLVIFGITGYIDTIFEFIENLSPHIILISSILFEAVMCVVYFTISHNSISKHLNLE